MKELKNISTVVLILLVVIGNTANGLIETDIIGSGSGNDNIQCQGTVNSYPVWTDEPILQNQVKNGKLFTTGPTNNTLNILHLYGTPYQMGYAHGQLLKTQINKMIPEFFMYGEAAIGEMIGKFAEKLSPEILEILEKFGLAVALDYVAFVTKPFTPQHYFDELQGLADGSGMDYQLLLQVHMFPELVKATCSIVGAWGDATANSGLLQLRALDWGLSSPLSPYPTFIVYHSQAGDGNPFGVLSWTGFIGALTGYSGHLGISQKVWIKYNGTYSHEGIPFYFILREMLQYDNTVAQALTRINQAHRTCSIFLGIGSNSTNTAEVVEYSYSYVNVFDDETPFPGYAPSPPQHPILKDVVYVDRHTQPSTDPCMASVLQSEYGKMTAQSLINLSSLQRTGDLHIAIYDYAANHVYVSVSTTSYTTYPIPSNVNISPSYANQFILLDMNTLFNI